jgi:deazaflavin-dependent oxidoreductase (nitroreductase family)
MTDLSDPAVFKAMNDPVVEEFRTNDGKVGGQFEGQDLLLLTTTGAKSGQPRLTPLAYFEIDDKLLVVGSKGGYTNSPDWVHNLRANPQAHVEIGTTEYDTVARELPLPERNETYPKVVAVTPAFGEYQERTSRVIPLFELQRA